MKALPPLNEAERIKALKELCILDSEAESTFDDLVEIASQVCGTPIALVSLVDSERQWFKAKKGIEAKETSRDLAFCAHAILQSNTLVVNDATKDKRFADNILVTTDPSIRFYAGSPLVTKDGHALGTLCAIDTKPKQLSDSQIKALEALSRQVVSQLENRLATKRAEENLVRLKTLSEFLSLGIFSTDTDGNCVYVNPSYRAISGLTDEQCYGGGWVGAIHPEDRDRVNQEWCKAIEEGRQYESGHRFQRPDGSVSYCHVLSSVVRNNQEVIGYVGSVEDITEHYEYLTKLEQQEQHLREAQALGKIGSWSFSHDTGVTTWSDETFKIFGWSKDDGAPSYEQQQKQIHPEDLHYWKRAVDKCLEDGASYEMEFRAIMSDGSAKIIQARGKGKKNSQGMLLSLSGTVQDVTKERKIERELAENAKRLDLALTGGDFGLWDWNCGTSEVVFNDSWAGMLGENLKDLAPNTATWESRVHPDDVELVKKHQQDHSQGLIDKYEVKHRLKHKLGGWRWILSRGKVVERDAAGVPLRIVGTNHDITAEAEAEEALKILLVKTSVAEELALAANKSKSEFLANMSHEIRTPMNGIIGMTQMLLESELQGSQNEIAKDIASSAQSLLDIINEILDLSKIEAGKIEIYPSDARFSNIIESVLSVLKPRILQKNIQVVTELEANVPEWISVDDVRLRQVVMNLVSNAVKFTPEHGRVNIKAQVDVEADGRLKLRVAVSDTGIGIEAGKLNLIFNPFTQAESGTTRRFGGTGLGLTISKKIVELMGGKIWVESALGLGSTFYFNVNISAVDAAQKAELTKLIASSAQGRFKTETRPCLLVVEDNLMNQKLMKMILQKMECDVEIAANGREAVDMYLAFPAKFDLILMDCQMPILNGFDATEEIRKIEAGSTTHVPIVAMTANAMEGDEEKCREVGMDDYLTKPIDRARMRTVLVRFLEKPKIPNQV